MRRCISKSSPILVGILLFAAFAMSQEKTRTLDESHRDYTYKDQPIKIVDRKVGSTPFPANNRLIADDNWIRDLSISVRNISEKTITFVSVDLVVRNDGKSPSQVRMRSEFGRPKQEKSIDGYSTGEYVRPTLKPGDTGKLRVNPEYYSSFAKQLESAGIQQVETLGIDINYIRFEGEIIWSKGIYMYPDPANPKKYLPAKRERPNK